MRRRGFVVGALALPALAACAAPDARSWDSQLILLRHMDRDPGNPILNARGRRRAELLAPALDDLAIDAILAPDLERNLLSAAPLAAARGIAPVTLDTSRNVTSDLLAAAEGRSVVWVGNATNLGEIWEDLALPGDPPRGYGEIAILRKAGTRAWVVAERRRFGR